MKHLHDPDIETDENRDLPNERRYTEQGQTVIVYPSDPHGFWRIRLEKKKTLPKVLDSAYTGLSEAEKAVAAYFHTLKATPTATSSN